MTGKPRKFNPDKDCPVNQAIPGWKETVKPQRESALFWHSIWVSAGRPVTGVLHNIMKKTRNQYHYAIRKVKKKSEEIRAAALLKASQSGDMQLLKEMKIVKIDSKGCVNLPDTVEGAEGQDEIIEKFREVYESLYNSAESEEAVKVIKNKLETLIGTDSLAEVYKITGDVVKKAATLMKLSRTLGLVFCNHSLDEIR